MLDGLHREPGRLQVADPASAAPAIRVFMDCDDLFLRGPASESGQGSGAGDQHKGRASRYRAMGHGRAFLTKQSNHRRVSELSRRTQFTSGNSSRKSSASSPKIGRNDTVMTSMLKNSAGG